MRTTAPERLAALQKRFADHIRDPERVPAPEGMEDRRMAIYRRLFFNNLKNLLSAQFPRVRALHENPEWESLIRDFMIRHRPRTPLFPELPNEFMHYLREIRRDPADPPFLVELAHFEWLMRALRLDEQEADNVSCDPDGDITAGIPVLSPLARLASYRFPVHRIDQDHRPDEPSAEPTLLLLYRDRDDRTGHLKLNPVSARLFQLLQANERHAGLELLIQIAGELRHPDPNKVVEHGRGVLEDFRRREIILGTRN